jgi:hypothetical protein
MVKNIMIMKAEYSNDVKDLLVSIYDFMVRENIPFTAENVYITYGRLHIGKADKEFCDKFIRELDEIKILSELQPLYVVEKTTLYYDKNMKIMDEYAHTEVCEYIGYKGYPNDTFSEKYRLLEKILAKENK